MNRSVNVQDNSTLIRTPEGFNEFYRQYCQKVLRKCMGMLKDPVAAQDAMQEIFIQAYLNRHRFRQEASVSTWLFAITRNYCFDHLRRRGRSIRTEQIPADDAIAGTVEISLETISEEKRINELQGVLRQLPEKDHRILMMKFRDNLSIKAIARKKRTTESAVKMRIFRAKSKARLLQCQLTG